MDTGGWSSRRTPGLEQDTGGWSRTPAPGQSSAGTDGTAERPWARGCRRLWTRAREKAARDGSAPSPAEPPAASGTARAAASGPRARCAAASHPPHSCVSSGLQELVPLPLVLPGKQEMTREVVKNTKKAASSDKEKCSCNICLTLVCSFISAKWSINQTGTVLRFFHGSNINLAPVPMKNEGGKLRDSESVYIIQKVIMAITVLQTPLLQDCSLPCCTSC